MSGFNKNIAQWSGGPQSSQVVAAGLSWFFSIRVIYNARLVMGDLQDLVEWWMGGAMIAHHFQPKRLSFAL